MVGLLYDEAERGPPEIKCNMEPAKAEEVLDCILQDDIEDKAARLSCVHQLAQAAFHCPTEGWVEELGGALASKRCETVTATTPRACDAAVRAHTHAHHGTLPCSPIHQPPCLRVVHAIVLQRPPPPVHTITL